MFKIVHKASTFRQTAEVHFTTYREALTYLIGTAVLQMELGETFTFCPLIGKAGSDAAHDTIMLCNGEAYTIVPSRNTGL